MKFNYIKYKNYRCFSDIEVSFETTKDKNISMVVAPNGGGKTEMLFSFWWVLYNFDFKKLKGKGYTPYSLNSTLYQELKNGKVGEHHECSVELCFEDDDTRLIVVRKEQYVKTNSGIAQNQTLTLEQKIISTGETLPLMKDVSTVESRISRIVPRNILGGIIFDGERMKQLSQIDDDARKAVEGVIKQITNEELFHRCNIELEAIQKANSKKISDCTKKGGSTNVSEIESRIATLTIAVQVETKKLEQQEDLLSTYEERLGEISEALAGLEDARELEINRTHLKNQLKDAEKSLEKDIDKMFKDLYQGSALITGKLIQDVKESLETVDVPSGLNVSAVRSIIPRPQCICGNTMTSGMVDTLKALLKNLPPDNINSTLTEMSRQMNMYSTELKKTLGYTYSNLHERENTIEQLKSDIAAISVQITEGASEQAKELEKENNELLIKKGEVLSQIKRFEENIKINSENIEKLKKERENASKGNAELSYLNRRDAYISKCIKAIKEIHEKNKIESIQCINSRLKEIYSNISEDKDRTVYITQFGDSRKKYRLISYLQEDFKKRKVKLMNSGKYHQFQTMGMSCSEIDETIINDLAQSSSTGQSKINSLAFAKAILEYSNMCRDEKSTELSRSFPFLIDSPFTELSDDNLRLPAQNIHSFAEQIILLISQESLSGVESYITPYVHSRTYLEKGENETTSHIKE